MKPRLRSLLLLLAFVFACQTEEDPQPIPKDPLTGLEKTAVQIKLPEGVNIDLANTVIYSQNLEKEVTETGQGEVLNLQDNPAFAYLFDREGNLILAGLIGPGRTELSAETTTEFLLYQSFGIPFMEEAFANRFFQEVRQFPIWDTSLNLVKSQLATDPMMLGKQEIMNKILGIVNPLAAKFRMANPNARSTANEPKASDLLVDGTIKSGVQAYQTGLNTFVLDNTVRRRSHAFLYKTEFINQAGSTEVIHTSVGSAASIVPDKEIAIAMVNGITGVSSTVYEYLIGDTEKSFRVTTDPVQIPLTDAEKAATWELRVIGVGTESIGLNSVERSKLVKLQMTTLTLDFIVPLIADGIAAKGLVSKGNDGPKGEEFLWEALITAVAGYVDKMPEIKTKIDKSEYDEAIKDFFTIGYNQFGSIFLEDLMKIAAETIYNSLPKDVARPNLETMKGSASRMFKVLGAIELLMKGSDYARKIYDIQSSKSLEIWEIKAKEIEVNLEPRETIVQPGGEKALTAFIKSTVADGTVIEYQWSTEGKFGELKDAIGHKGKSFTSSSKNVTYVCTAAPGAGSENRQDVVKVEIYMKVGQVRYKIGADEAIMKVGDKEVFNVGWEKKIVYIEKMDGNKIVYSMSNGGFAAIIPEKEGAKFYDLVNIRENGTRTTTIRKSPADLKTPEGKLEYWVKIGGLFLFETYSKEKLQEKINEVEKQLDAAKPNYGSLEVTVIR
ncbi:hypothetical protein [Algoriphagus sp. A40]|uniref:hypothetical protein n=1 Tax=Algoriphagus sp. A40 TaxID=1945863 RepID=UPI0011158C8B|nr:hypothetical protein [Algoriphagus sp. A40]